MFLCVPDPDLENIGLWRFKSDYQIIGSILFQICIVWETFQFHS